MMNRIFAWALALTLAFAPALAFAQSAQIKATVLSYKAPAPAGGGGGTVTVGAKSSSVTNCSPCTTLTFNLTLTTENAVAVMMAWSVGVFPTVTAVTYNGVTMTAVPNTQGSGGGCSCAVIAYGVLGPASGTHAFSITWTGSIEAHAIGIAFNGVNQGSVAAAFPNGTQIVQNTSTASPITATITSATGHIVPAMATQQSSGWGAINGTTIATDSVTGPNMATAANYNSGAATVAPSFAYTGPGDGTLVAFDVSP